MTFEEIEKLALGTEETDWLRLAHRLLDGAETANLEVERLWVEEALCRDSEIEDGAVQTIPAEEVLHNARAGLEALRRGRR